MPLDRLGGGLDFGTMPTFRAPRGTRDLLPDERAVFDNLQRTAASLIARYGYRPIETPLFEQAAVFERGIGEVTDVVEKELFRIAPRTDEAESWALRPEPTAGIVRAYVQHGMQTWPQPVKLTTTGPMFRYDRPQAGRYRQFWQFDVEAIGDPGPAIDAEIIELGTRFYAEAGVTGVEVLVNSIGDPGCRPAYIAELVSWYRGHEAVLPPTERDRLERNALRLLDSKDPAMAEVNAGAPRITDRLCDACAAHFESVRTHLAALGVPFRVEPGLVRGLDYYSRTAFEFYVAGREGQQQALGGGGRYDGLVELLGGRPTPGIGFGLGLDRVALVLAEQAPGDAVGRGLDGPLAVVVGADPDDTVARLRIATELRAAGLRVRADLARRRLGRQLEAAGKDGAHFAVIIGDELASGQVQMRDLLAGTQRVVGVGDLARELARAEAGHRHG
jgi:histidyl-tRNA synthetase